MWMSCTASRSSIHYDPYHNILSVVSGKKTVTLWAPSAAPYLYPMPLYGEASNHSAVDFVKPDYEEHPLFREAFQHSKVVELKRGDALFIPEGWFHQVDSSALTIAVNFWWPSKISSGFSTHMDAYYLRRILVSLLDTEKELMLGAYGTPAKSETSSRSSSDNSSLLEDLKLEDLSGMESYQLHTIVSWSSSVAENKPEPRLANEVTRVLANAGPLSLRRVLQVMAQKFPRTLEVVILNGLSPAAGELLTRRFEEMDQLASEQSQTGFYELFYSVFEDPQKAMGVLLDKKEAFAAEALSSVVQRFLNLKP